MSIATAPLLAVLAAALSAGLLVAPAPRVARARVSAPRPATALLAVPVLAVLALARSPAVAVLAVLAAGVATGVALLLRRRTCRRNAAVVRGRVLETCELLAAELAAGQPPGRALRRAAAAWPALAPVAEAFDLGGDVPDALREMARRAGAGDLRMLAAAWVVSHRTGHGLADAVRRVADAIRGTQSTRRVVEGELASARATARLVAALPVVALLMGSGTGGDPVGFLFSHPVGLACLAGGLGFGLGGLWWIEAIADDADAAA